MEYKKINGQSSFDNDLNIITGIKSAYDVDIDVLRKCYIHNKDYNQNGNSIADNYIKRTKEKAEKERQTYNNSYNAKLLNYPNGQHVTLYTNTIQCGIKKENYGRTKHKESRTDIDIEHCIKTSMNRTKNSIYNIARSYNWKWFVTFTFERTKSDASDYVEVVEKLKHKLNHTQQRICPNLKYIIVPELHKDGTNYHFHGLFANCDELNFVFSGKFDKHGRNVFNIPMWSWGFSTATLVGDTRKASSYICKYVTKDTEHYLFNKRRYFSNVKKTVAEKLVVDDVNGFIEMYADDITYIKQTYIKEAHQKVTFLEMPY